MLFHAKIGILGKYFYVSHTLFILYLEGNHTLFREKLCFIWKFSCGNTDCWSRTHPLWRSRRSKHHPHFQRKRIHPNLKVLSPSWKNREPYQPLDDGDVLIITNLYPIVKQHNGYRIPYQNKWFFFKWNDQNSYFLNVKDLYILLTHTILIY